MAEVWAGKNGKIVLISLKPGLRKQPKKLEAHS
jgi:hypothetical protein